ncbi:MAG: hypothetical protein CM15mP3_06660 [Candidatus Poseidoniales archaeon]|nr:MAG: hypothetical protein CM15mP3_06660 [Candidatus Poseidoniales archaeon]
MLTITVRVEDSGDSAIGDSHWRMSLPGGNTYPSSAFDRLVYSYRNPTQDCGGDALDVGLGQIEGIWVCRVLFKSQEYISTQVHLQAWGQLRVQGMQPTLNFGTKTAIFPTHWNQ